MSAQRLFKFVALLSVIFALGLGFELVLNLKGKRLCELSSCLLVGEMGRISHQAMVALGLLYFGTLSVLAAATFKGSGVARRLLLLTVSAGLFSELIFLLRQAFDYGLFCEFCLAVAAGVFLTGIPVVFKLGTKGVAAAAGVILGFVLTSVPLKPIENLSLLAFPERPENSNLILIYSPDCPHCHEVLEFCKDAKDLNLMLCKKENALPLLRNLNLKGVPVLVAKRDPLKIEIIQGAGPIISYLKNEKGTLEEAFKPSERGLEELLILEGGICSEVEPKCE